VTVCLPTKGRRSARAQCAVSRQALFNYIKTRSKDDNLIFWIKLTCRNKIRKERECRGNDFSLFLLALNRRENSTKLRNNNLNFKKTICFYFFLRQVGTVHQRMMYRIYTVLYSTRYPISNAQRTEISKDRNPIRNILTF